MDSSPQNGVANLALLTSVASTYFLASLVCITKIFHELEWSSLEVMVVLALLSTSIIMLILVKVVERELWVRIKDSVRNMFK